jgi:hypothetical protein
MEGSSARRSRRHFDRPRTWPSAPRLWIGAYAAATKPCRCSISTCPTEQSFASWPVPLRYSRASGSVVEAWLSLVRRSPWKSRLPLRPPVGGAPGSSLGRKLFIEAQASTRLPSTLKCSLDNRRRTCGWSSSSARNAAATSPASRRSRFFEKVEWSQTASSMPRPTTSGTAGRSPGAPSAGAPSGSNRLPAAGALAAAARRDRGATDPGIEVMQARRKPRERLVDDQPDGPPRMGGRHPGLKTDVAEQGTRTLIRTAHPVSSPQPQLTRNSPKPASFSTAC